jgi:hypothetical protein
VELEANLDKLDKLDKLGLVPAFMDLLRHIPSPLTGLGRYISPYFNLHPTPSPSHTHSHLVFLKKGSRYAHPTHSAAQHSTAETRADRPFRLAEHNLLTLG